jgi:diguanylate cyclase (GGDEF)-like protein
MLPGMGRPPIESPHEALRAVTRLLNATTSAAGPASVTRTLVTEARTLFDAFGVALLAVEPQDRSASVVDHCGDCGSVDARPIDAALLPPVAELLDGRSAAVVVDAPDALRQLTAALNCRRAPGPILALALRGREALEHVLIVQLPEGDVPPEHVEAGVAFAAAAAAGLAQLRLAAEQARRTAQQAALARAAKALNATLDLPDVLEAISREALTILGADVAAVYRGDPNVGMVIEAAQGFSAAAVGYVLGPGQGLSGRVGVSGRAMLTNDYQRVAQPSPASPFADVRSCLAVPMRWDGELRGVLSVGFNREHHVRFADLSLLEAFAELAAAACANASLHASALLSARTDGLTGCLNHAALMDELRREVERCERTNSDLSVVLLDLDDFKGVNERAGHLVGDEVLRRVGHALRLATRPYDLVARHGGDEFAIVTLGADEAAALRVATRALEQLGVALEDLPPGTRATAGVAAWRPGRGPDDLLAAADTALLHAKTEGGRGRAVAAGDLPETATGLAPVPRRVQPTTRGTAGAERLQQRTRQFALAAALGARLSAMTDVQSICDATVAELHRALGFPLCAVIRVRPDGYVEAAAAAGPAFERLTAGAWSQPRDAGVIGRCLRERTVVLVDDIRREGTYCATEETGDVRSELVAPILVGDRVWGVLNCESTTPSAYSADDARLLRAVADQVGSALRSALLFERLERAYLGTAEALAAALEAKDSYTAQHGHSIVRWAEAVGRRMGIDEDGLRDLRYAAIFHDIGKIAVPEAILHKRGPLDAAERAIMERHPVVGAQILAPVEFLAGVLPLVRHEHERFDGRGYPDGLHGAAIPLGARIILACDAYHAMTSDRPYRDALAGEVAFAELRANAGTQFDPEVVEELLAVLAAEDRVASV